MSMARNGRRLIGLFGVAVASTLPPAALAQSSAAESAPVSRFDDPRVAGWAQAIVAGKPEAAIRAIAADLASAQPHPFAAHAWLMAHKRAGRDMAAAVAAAPVPVRELVAREAAVWEAAAGNRWATLIAMVDPDGPPQGLSPWALSAIFEAARALGKPATMLAVAEAQVRRFPDSLSGANNARMLIADYGGAEYRAQLMRVIAAPEIAASPAAGFLRRVIEDRDLLVGDRQAIAATLWNGRSDWFAIRYVGAVACDRYRFGQCRAAREQAWRLYPFADEADQTLAGAAFRESGESAMEQRIADQARGAVDPARLAHRERARALIEAGENGAARRAIEAGLKAHPDDPALLARFAALEVSDRRHARAAALYRTLLKADPGDVALWEGLLNAHREADDLDGADAVWDEAVAALKSPLPSRTLVNYRIQALQAQDAHAEAIALGRAYLAENPDSGWTMRNLVISYQKLEQTANARAMLERSIARGWIDSWVASRAVEIGDAEQPGGGDAALAALARRAPWERGVVDAQNARAGEDAPERKVQFARAAVERAPGAFWPYYYLAFYEARRGRQAESEAAYAAGMRAMPADAAGRRAELLTERTRERLRGSRIDAAAIERDLADADALGGDRSLLLDHRRQLYARTGRAAQAAATLAEMAQTAPDGPVIDLLFAAGPEPAYAKVKKRDFPALARYIDRRPFDPQRLGSGAFRHALWGGGPVHVLDFVRRLEEASPQAYRTGRAQEHRLTALGQLGDHQTMFRERYDGKSNGPCCSPLYEGWYDDARAKAQGASGFVLADRIDYARKRAAGLTADGIEIERGYHPVSGRLNYYRVGGAEMSADYDADGTELLGITDSGGRSFRLDYDDEGRIVRYHTVDGKTLTFAYNARNKPVMIDMGPQGRLDVTYDERDEIVSSKASGGAGGDHLVALAANKAFQDLGSRVNLLTRATRDLPELDHADPVHAALVEQRQRAIGDDQFAMELKLAAHEVANLAKRRAYAGQARARLGRLLAAAWEPGADARRVQVGLDAAALWIELNRKIYRHGMPIEVWRTSTRLRAWLAALAVEGRAEKRVAQIQAALAENGGALLQQARWLPRSYLSNPAFWRRFTPEAVLPRQIGGRIDAQVVLTRGNGDVVIGSAAGLSVYRRGFWEWYSWDADRRRFSPDLSPAGARARPQVRALAEDGDGRLWVALDDALVRLDGEYGARAIRFTSEMQNLTRTPIRQLVTVADGVLAGSDTGLRLFGIDGARPLPDALKALADAPVSLLRTDAVPGGGTRLLIGSTDGLFAFDGAALTKLSAPVDDAVLAGGQILTLRANEVRLADWNMRGRVNPATAPDHANIVFSRRIDGLGTIEIEDGGIVPAVLTDQGMSIYHDGHFEHLKLPLVDREAGVRLAQARGGQSVMATSEGVFVVERARVAVAATGRVHDILSLPRFGATMIAYGGRVDALPHDSDTAVPRRFASIRARILAEAPDGSLITHDGPVVLRFRSGSTDPEELFTASGKILNQQGRVGSGAAISSILAASDGTIWVTAGGSLFRWTGGGTETFSMFDEDARFPVRADQLARVIETVEGKIWLVAGDDSHRVWRGEKLAGGLFEWNGNGFVQRADQQKAQWFLSSYTRIGEGEAIAGTTRGLAVHRGGILWAIDGKRDASYAALHNRQPMLFRGTRGTRFGDDGWLFGTAGGVVAYYKGQWLYPNRLNWLLPDNHLSQYGARTVHGVGADPKGRILIGTDRGLMIYQSAGNSILQFLVNENLPEMAFAALESQKLAAESATLLAAAPKGSAMAAQVERYEASKLAVETARAALAAGGGGGETPMRGEAQAVRGETRGGGEGTAAAARAGPDLGKELERREAMHKQLLADLERDNRSLYQMLELKPLDLDVWRRRLRQGEVVVQYLPTPEKLIIHVASRDQSVIREVKVTAAELEQRSRRLAEAMAGGARTLSMRAPDVEGADPNPAAIAAQAYDRAGELHWLYEQLLRPIENELAGFEDVYIAPVGILTKVPFAALIRTPGRQPEYAAQRFTLGVVPSLYLLDLVLNGGSRSGAGVALFGNPDGTLPGAEAEARSIGDIVGAGAKLKLRGEATFDAVRGLARGSRWLHFATHGVLDGKDPSRSYLVLAGGRRLSVIDAMQLDLSQTEMVVLSACESGVGSSGLEYATLTRAFAHAGATSIIASLWKVDDKATRLLMERFYTHREAGAPPFKALALAQREMMQAKDAMADPAAWSAFLAFGKN